MTVNFQSLNVLLNGKEGHVLRTGEDVDDHVRLLGILFSISLLAPAATHPSESHFQMRVSCKFHQLNRIHSTPCFGHKLCWHAGMRSARMMMSTYGGKSIIIMQTPTQGQCLTQFNVSSS